LVSEEASRSTIAQEETETMNDVSSKMVMAYRAHQVRATRLIQVHEITPALGDADEFSLIVQNKFFLGVHKEYLEAILNALASRVGLQQDIAAVLGLKDRSSIAQMIRSGTIEGVRLTAALHQFPDVRLPSRERAALAGFARATSFVKSLARKEKSIEGTMSSQDFSYLIGILANSDWDAAIRDTVPERARHLAAEIVSERTLGNFQRARNPSLRPEQLVFQLQELCVAWADYGIIALWAIPECIPCMSSLTVKR
jgi:hypothetical protein